VRENEKDVEGEDSNIELERMMVRAQGRVRDRFRYSDKEMAVERSDTPTVAETRGPNG